MRQDNPKVSVCLMTYNGAATVERALTTLLAQTYHDYELIISDDHSTDGTLAICERVAAGHAQVRFIRPERNLGSQGNMRFALSQARGKYFLWACQDDYWKPRYLERVMALLDQSPTAICAQSRFEWISSDGKFAYDMRIMGKDRPECQSRLRQAVAILTQWSWEHRTRIKTLYMHGVWNLAAFTAALDAYGKVFAKERFVVCQLALAGEFRYVDELLFHKTFHVMELDERYPENEPVVMAKRHSTSRGKLVSTLAGIIRSPIVSLGMKVVALPTLYLAVKWSLFRSRDFDAGLRHFLPTSIYNALKRLYRRIRPRPPRLTRKLKETRSNG